ncbi:DUF3108 domain-containing protein [Amphritea sp. 2_MG-2023]|jgi:hypothetical protein|uniref:DUF3108 domain-containing protein n=1 Tax=Amphritea TaxID=515417 RepID=UPI001C0704C0|nr:MULTISPECIES: DUF3108 domain-containing protein [Amphritea]MBU2966304.1 DUF3108 domain-containing protein [Amphritea atlantica]MDO6420243.1 DUF3108 domain-containing protein [Amphritea sp. 2_MG-2023]MDX2422651.1 DUF3108 domain-containing protein [Amphritea sp.]
MRFSKLLIPTLLFICALPTQASELFKPYKAVYKAQWDIGISFGGDAISELTRNGDRWKHTLNATALIAKVDEFTEFTLQDQNVLPQHYEYHRKVIGNNKNAVLQFNWSTGTVLNDIAKKPWTMNIPAGTQDKLSYQMQMRLDLAAGKKELSYQVADGGKIKTYPFIIVGMETVSTGIGSFEAVKIQRDRGPDSNRETFLWCAPELGYMVVKLQQVEKSGKEYSLLIDKLDFMEP